MPQVSTRRGLITVAAIGLTAALAGCSGSSSGGQPAATGTDAPAAAQQTFHHVTKAEYRQLSGALPTMRGVAGVTYQGRSLRVQFRGTAVKLDQTNVANIVQNVENGGTPAGPKPTKTAHRHHHHHHQH